MRPSIGWVLVLAAAAAGGCGEKQRGAERRTPPAGATTQPAPTPDPDPTPEPLYRPTRTWFACTEPRRAAVDDPPRDAVDLRRPGTDVRGHPGADLRAASVAASESTLCVQWVARGPLGKGSILSLVLTARGGAPIEVNAQLASSTKARLVASGFGQDGDVTRSIEGEVGISGRRASMRVLRDALPPSAPSLRRFGWAVALEHGGILDQAPAGGFPSLRFPG